MVSFLLQRALQEGFSHVPLSCAHSAAAVDLFFEPHARMLRPPTRGRPLIATEVKDALSLTLWCPPAYAPRRDEQARSFGWSDVNFPVPGSGETKGAPMSSSVII